MSGVVVARHNTKGAYRACHWRSSPKTGLQAVQGLTWGQTVPVNLSLADTREMIHALPRHQPCLPQLIAAAVSASQYICCWSRACQVELSSQEACVIVSDDENCQLAHSPSL